MNMLADVPAAKIRILALHGRGSNGGVTRLQLRNLGISESEYDVLYVDGPISSDRPGPGIAELEELVPGPWYSWLPDDDAVWADGPALRNAICDAVEYVLSILQNDGPFDAVFGFSQGGLIANLVNGLSTDQALISALQQRSNSCSLPNGTPFNAAVIACAGSSLPLPELRLKAELGPAPQVSPQIHSLHLIGREDDYRPWSESFASSLDSTATDV